MLTEEDKSFLLSVKKGDADWRAFQSLKLKGCLPYDGNCTIFRAWVR